jgi:uncharacterized membrane protein YfcA
MELTFVALVAFAAALLTFVSGFGLGTLLMPAMALFMPIEAAVALTALVHLLVNVLKISLVGREANRQVLLNFGIPSLCGAVIGGWTLTQLGDEVSGHVVNYGVGNLTFSPTPVALSIGMVMLTFAIAELTPAFSSWRPSPRWQGFGGLASGFLGGLSGHQGAIRSAFLSGMGNQLTAVSFAATGAIIACTVDIARLAMYHANWASWSNGRLSMLAAGTIAALLGTWIGSRLIRKITLPLVQRVVSVLLILLGLGLVTGWVR